MTFDPLCPAGTAIELQEHKKYTLNKSTEKLKAGINEAKVRRQSWEERG